MITKQLLKRIYYDYSEEEEFILKNSHQAIKSAIVL